MSKAKPKFQKQIYVYEEKDGNDSYYCSWKSPEEIPSDHVGPVAIYQLVKVGEVKRTAEFVS